MRNQWIGLIAALWIISACNTDRTVPLQAPGDEEAALISLVRERERAMVEKDIDAVMAQFADDATWINSQGYYFEGKQRVEGFHRMLAGNDSLDYYYEAGEPLVRVLDADHGLAYYGWKMFWYRKDAPTDTTTREIGLMTLTAHRGLDGWKWVAVTNQHTPWFHATIDPVTADD